MDESIKIAVAIFHTHTKKSDQGGLGRHDHLFLPHPAQGYKFLSQGEWLVDILPGVFADEAIGRDRFFQ